MIISISGNQASGKTTLTETLSEKGYGCVLPFFLARREFEDALIGNIFGDPHKGEWRKYATLGMFATYWHQHAKHIEGPIIFDHYYPDYFVMDLGTIDGIEYVQEFAELYDVPGLAQGAHFFLDVDYPTYLCRRESRLREGERLMSKARFCRNRENYMRLVESESLIYLNGMQSKCDILKEAIGIIEILREA